MSPCLGLFDASGGSGRGVRRGHHVDCLLSERGRADSHGPAGRSADQFDRLQRAQHPGRLAHRPATGRIPLWLAALGALRALTFPGAHLRADGAARTGEAVHAVTSAGIVADVHRPRTDRTAASQLSCGRRHPDHDDQSDDQRSDRRLHRRVRPSPRGDRRGRLSHVRQHRWCGGHAPGLADPAGELGAVHPARGQRRGDVDHRLVSQPLVVRCGPAADGLGHGHQHRHAQLRGSPCPAARTWAGGQCVAVAQPQRGDHSRAAGRSAGDDLRGGACRAPAGLGFRRGGRGAGDLDRPLRWTGRRLSDGRRFPSGDRGVVAPARPSRRARAGQPLRHLRPPPRQEPRTGGRGRVRRSSSGRR